MSPCGVPTAMKIASLCSTASPRSVVKVHALAPVPGQQLGQVLLEDGHAAFAQDLDPGFVVVYADDTMAHLRKTYGRHKPHIAGPDHTDGNWL